MIPAAILSVVVQVRGVMQANRSISSVETGLGEAERAAIDATNQVDKFGRTTATARVLADTSSATRDVRALRAEIASLSDRTVHVRTVTDSDGGAGADVSRAIGQANLLQRTIALVKPAAMIAGLGMATQGMAAAAAGAIALTGALAPLAGAMALYPALGSAMGQAMAVAKVGVMGLTGDVGDKLKKALETPIPAAKDFQTQLKSFIPEIVHLRNIAQGPILRGLASGVAAASKNLGVLNPIVRGTANVLGGLAKEAGQLVGSSAFGRDLATVGQRNVKIIDILGHAALDVGDALRHVVVEAGPLTMWLTRLVGGWAEGARQAAATGRETGRMAQFFESTRQVMSRLFSIAGSLGSAFWNIAKAGKGLGDDLLASLDKTAAGFARWTKSVEGQNKIKQFFENARGPIYEVGKLIRDVTKGFLSLSQQPGLEKIIRQLRTELLPVLLRVMNSTTAAFGPAFVNMIVAVANAFEPLAGSSGPLVLYVKILTELAQAATWIMRNVPGAATAVSVLVGAFAVSKAVGFAGAITGVTKAVTAMRVAYLVSTGAITAETSAQTANNLAKNVGIVTAIRHTAAMVAQRVIVVAVRAATLAAAAAQWILNAALLANPIGLVIVGVAALVAAFVLLGGKVGWLGDVFVAVWDWIKGATSVAWGAIKATLAAVWGWIVSDVTMRLNAVRTAVGTAWSVISSVTSAVWNAIRSVISGVWSAISSAVSTQVAAVRSVVTGAWSAISSATSTAWNAIKSAIGSAIDLAAGAVRGAVSGLREYMSSAWSSVRDRARDAWEGVKDAISGAIRSAVSTVRGLVGQFVDVGGDIVRGIARGVTSAAGSLLGAIGDLVSGAVSKAKSLLKIGSPSRVFAEIGQNTGIGFVQGIAAQITSAQDAIAQLTAAPGVTARGMVGGGVNRDYARDSMAVRVIFEGLPVELQKLVRVEIDAEGAASRGQYVAGLAP